VPANRHSLHLNTENYSRRRRKAVAASRS
jgi:hypothetical protein